MDKLKRFISLCLTVIMLVLSSPIALANSEAGTGGGGFDGRHNAGSDTDSFGGGSIGAKVTWTFDYSTGLQSGYRITLVDAYLNRVPGTRTLDMVFSDPNVYLNSVPDFNSRYNDYYINHRFEGLLKYSYKHRDKIYICMTLDDLWDYNPHMQKHKKPEPPIISSGGTIIAQGIKFRDWFVSGADMIKGSEPSNTSTNKGGIEDRIRSGNALTVPKKESELNSLDIQVDFSAIPVDASYRRTLYTQAYNYLVSQGLYDTYIDNAIGAGIRYLKSRIEYYNSMRKPKYTAQTLAVRDLIKTYIGFGETNAQSAVIIISAINSVLGINWEASWGDDNNKVISMLDKIFISDGVKELSNGSLLVPLSGGSVSQPGKDLLDCVDPKGNYIFNVPGIPGETISDNIVRKKYYILVEPLFWYRPSTFRSGENTLHPNYLYGTIANAIDFYTSNTQYGPSGGAYSRLVKGTAMKSMYVAQDVNLIDYDKSFVAGTQVVATKIDGVNSSLLSQASLNVGSGGLSISALKSKYFSVKGGGGSVNGLGYHIYKTEDIDIKNKVMYIYYTTEQNGKKVTISKKGPIKLLSNRVNVDGGDGYVVNGWFTTDVTDAGANTFEDSAKQLGYIRKGDSETELVLQNNEKAIHIELFSSPSGDAGRKDVFEENLVVKAVTTGEKQLETFGHIEPIKFICESMEGSHQHLVSTKPSYYVECDAVFGDNSYTYRVHRVNPINESFETDIPSLRDKYRTNAFKTRMKNEVKSGTVKIQGEENIMLDYKHLTALYRNLSEDKFTVYEPSMTIVEDYYKNYDKTNYDIYQDLKSLYAGSNLQYLKYPSAPRPTRTYKPISLSIKLAVDRNSSDLITYTVHSAKTSQIYIQREHKIEYVYKNEGLADKYETVVNMACYAGNNLKNVGDLIKSNIIYTSTPFGSAVSYNSAGRMVKSSRIPIVFYPYIRMNYQIVGDVTNRPLYVVSQYYSKILPNDFAEAAWYNPEEESLKMSSTQWSTHVRATNGKDFWRQPNQVLPGGALYQLGTSNIPTKVALVTWQTVLTDTEKQKLAPGFEIKGNDYSVARANSEHRIYVEKAKEVLESLRIVQWVNANVGASKANEGSNKVKIKDGGESLEPLGLKGTSSLDDKYRFKGDSSKQASSEFDLDILKETNQPDVYYKIFVDTEGDVYLAKGNSLSDVEFVNGVTYKYYRNSFSNVTKVYSGKGGSDLVNSLSGEAREIELRTQAISNLLRALEIGTGFDIPGWYNEAWDGICIVRKATVLDIGFKYPQVRQSVLDPNLCPKNEGKADLFSKAFLSQFTTDSRSDAFPGKPEGYIGTFKGVDIILPNMYDMYKSKKFYIPNVNVQDLK
ncbi:MAG: hypothetical protein QXD03_02445 [Candidatus Anstonellales archaeon]